MYLWEVPTSSGLIGDKHLSQGCAGRQAEAGPVFGGGHTGVSNIPTRKLLLTTSTGDHLLCFPQLLLLSTAQRTFPPTTLPRQSQRRRSRRHHVHIATSSHKTQGLESAPTNKNSNGTVTFPHPATGLTACRATTALPNTIICASFSQPFLISIKAPAFLLKTNTQYTTRHHARPENNHRTLLCASRRLPAGDPVMRVVEQILPAAGRGNLRYRAPSQLDL